MKKIASAWLIVENPHFFALAHWSQWTPITSNTNYPSSDFWQCLRQISVHLQSVLSAFLGVLRRSPPAPRGADFPPHLALLAVFTACWGVPREPSPLAETGTCKDHVSFSTQHITFPRSWPEWGRAPLTHLWTLACIYPNIIASLTLQRSRSLKGLK